MNTLTRTQEAVKAIPKDYIEALIKMLIFAGWLSAFTWIILEIFNKGMWS